MEAPCNLSSDLKKKAMNKEVFWAVANNLIRSSVTYSDLEQNAHLSGTLVDIAGRLFVATCRHGIPEHPSRKLDFATKKGPVSPAIHAEELLSWGRSRKNWPDVAFVEISPQSRVLESREPIGLDRIELRGSGKCGLSTYVFGWPFALSHTDSRPARTMKGMCYIHQPIDPAAWLPHREPETDRDVDIFLKYDVQQNMLEHEYNDLGELVPPDGMSGGGIWQGLNKKEDVWTAEVVKLFGIQCRYNKEEKYVRGCQIIHWLRLLYEKREELRTVLEGRFGEAAMRGT